MKERYTVGEFSKLFGLNVQTLRFYDTIGLFKPAFRDAWTGRRFYTFDQVYKLASIRYMRRIGHSLSDIQGYFDNLTSDSSLEILKKRSSEIQRQVDELLKTDHIIQRKIQFIEREIEKIGDLSEIRVIEFPDREYIRLGVEDTLYRDDSFYFVPTIAFYDAAGGKTFGALIYSSTQSYDERDWVMKTDTQVLTIPAGKYLCGYHCGSYETIGETASRMRRAVPEGRFADELINFNVIDQFVEKDRDKYITNVQIMTMEPDANS